MEKRVSKIVAIALMVSLCGAIVRASFSDWRTVRGVKYAGNSIVNLGKGGWSLTKGLYNKASTALSYFELVDSLTFGYAGSITEGYLGKYNPFSLRSMLHTAITTAGQKIIAELLAEYLGGLKKETYEWIVKVVFPEIITISYQTYRARGAKGKVRAFTAAGFKLIVARAFTRVVVNGAIKKAGLPDSAANLIGSYLLNKAASIVGNTTANILVKEEKATAREFLPVKQQIVPERLQATLPVIQKREIAPSPDVAQVVPSFVVQPVASRQRATPAKRAVSVRPVAQQRQAARPRVSRVVARRQEALNRLRRKQAAGRARRRR